MHENKKKKFYLASVLLITLAVLAIPVLRKCQQLYFVRFVGIGNALKDAYVLEPNSTRLPIGQALCFIDHNDHFGYVYFTCIEYWRAEYVLKVFHGDKTSENKGGLTWWRPFPWMDAKTLIFDGHEKQYPHFTWTPHNMLFFRYPKIKSVCVLPLATVTNDTFDVNTVTWLKTKENND